MLSPFQEHIIPAGLVNFFHSANLHVFSRCSQRDTVSLIQEYGYLLHVCQTAALDTCAEKPNFNTKYWPTKCRRLTEPKNGEKRRLTRLFIILLLGKVVELLLYSV